MMPTHPSTVVAGVDTHLATHHVAVLDHTTGALLGDLEIETSLTGYRQLLDFVTSFGTVALVGVEGTSSYGAGLSRFLTRAGIAVREVIRPKRAARRLHGKTDPLDAILAARTLLTGETLPLPKPGTGTVEGIRVLLTARESAVKARTQAIVQLKSLLVTAPDQVRDTYRRLTGKALHAKLAACRPHGPVDQSSTMTALRSLARRIRDLDDEINLLNPQLQTLVAQTAPGLLDLVGVGVISAAQLLVTVGDDPTRIHSKAAFAKLCGVAPIPASSGKTHRMRLNRGGDRRANRALHTIALARARIDPDTIAYLAKKQAEGKTRREAIRCLKRYISHLIITAIWTPPVVPPIDDLRPLRHAKGLTTTQAGHALGVWPARISGIERGTLRNDTLTTRYREWLTTA